MHASRWLVAISLFLVAGFPVYQWFTSATAEKMPGEAEGTSSTVETEERSESTEPPSFSARGESKSRAEVKSDISGNGSAGRVNPFMSPPEGAAEQTENADVVDESRESGPETEQPENTTRDLLKEVPDSYPIEDAEAYYVPPEERYPGNLGGPPPLKLPPINVPDPASSPQPDDAGESSGELAPPAPF